MTKLRKPPTHEGNTASGEENIEHCMVCVAAAEAMIRVLPSAIHLTNDRTDS